MSKSRITSGAGVNVFINGKDWGFVIGLNINPTSQRRKIGSIDTLLPYELAPVGVEISGSVRILRIIDDGGLENRNITSGFYNIQTEPYFTLLLKERASGRVLFKADYCSVEAQSWDYEARSLVTGQFQFSGLTWSNDYTTGPAIPTQS